MMARDLEFSMFSHSYSVKEVEENPVKTYEDKGSFLNLDLDIYIFHTYQFLFKAAIKTFGLVKLKIVSSRSF